MNKRANGEKSPKTIKKPRRICPFCKGDDLKKQKVILNKNDLNISVQEDIGELIVTIYDNENTITNQSKFHIKYCPLCGRKVNEKYRKLEELKDSEKN